MKKGKTYTYIALILLAIIAQKSLVPIMFFGRRLPDIVLMLVLALAIVDGFDDFLPWVIGAGLAYDVATRSAIGLHALIFVIVVYSVSFFSRRFLVDMRSMGVMLLLVFIILATLISHFFVALWIGWDSRSVFNGVGALGSGWDIAAHVLYNAVAFIIMFGLARNYTKKHIALISPK